MTSPRTSALLTTVLALLLPSRVSTLDGQVLIDQTKVTLICPLGETDGGREETDQTAYIWHEGDKSLKTSTEKEHVIEEYSFKEVKHFKCAVKDSSEIYHFYLKVKVCKNCVEVSLSVTVAIILGDLLFTGAVSLIVYCVTKKKGRGAREFVRTGMDPGSRPPHRRGPTGPAVPDPDYARLNRDRDVYDRPNHKR